MSKHRAKRIARVTGASRGIRRAVASALTSAGVDVAMALASHGDVTGQTLNVHGGWDLS